MLIDSVFDADLEYDISFESACFLTIEYEPQNHQKRKKSYPEHNVVKYIPCDQYFLTLKSRQFCGAWKGLSNGEKPNLIAFTIG
jgi:hypothetical protein